MINQDIIMLILNCKKYMYKAIHQRDTWLKNIPEYIKYYHVIGEESLDTDFKFDDTQNILWVKVADDYLSLPKKVIAALFALHQTFTYKYVFKTDDDQMLVNPNFFNMLNRTLVSMKPMTHYGGFVNNITSPHISTYNLVHSEVPPNVIIKPTKYCSGRFYFLSYFAVIHLLTQRPLIENEYFEDYAIGYYLSPILKQNILSISISSYFRDIEF